MAWIARDKDYALCLYENKPIRTSKNIWIDNINKGCLAVLEDYCDELFINKTITWEDEPVKIEIVPSISNIKIEYDGAYPNLCSGHLIVIINNVEYDFGTGCLISGGSCHWADAYEPVTKGPWDVNFPEDFPEMYKQAVLEKINEEIPQGCCGGCL